MTNIFDALVAVIYALAFVAVADQFRRTRWHFHYRKTLDETTRDITDWEWVQPEDDEADG